MAERCFTRVTVRTGEHTYATLALTADAAATAVVDLPVVDHACLAALHAGADPGIVAAVAVGEEWLDAGLVNDCWTWVLSAALHTDAQAGFPQGLADRLNDALTTSTLVAMMRAYLVWHRRCGAAVGQALGLTYLNVREDDLDHTRLRGCDHLALGWMFGT